MLFFCVGGEVNKNRVYVVVYLFFAVFSKDEFWVFPIRISDFTDIVND